MDALISRLGTGTGILSRTADRMAGLVLRSQDAAACSYYGRACCRVETCHNCDVLYCSGRKYCTNCSYFCC